MAHGITFGTFHTWDDLDISMSEEAPDVGTAEIYENYMDIPGGIPLDASEYPGGYPTYKKRHMSFKFLKKNNEESWPSIVSRVMNAIHGKSLDVVLDDDPGWTYHGRVKVLKPYVTKPMTALGVEVEALPYKEYYRSVADNWTWDETDFGSDINLVDGGLTDVAVGEDSYQYLVTLPYSPCGGTITATVEVTGFYGSATSGSLSIINSDNTSKYTSISSTGTYSASVTAAYDERSRNITVRTGSLVGTLTVDFTPRSL